MKSLSIVLVTSTFAASNIFAGTATFSGYGEMKSDPDFVELNVVTTSECFTKATAAAEANDKIANTVMKMFEKYIDPANQTDKVLATGGYVERYTAYDPNTRANYCVNTFRKVNTITLRTSRLENFSRDFAAIQDEVYALPADQPVAGRDAPVSFLTIGQPTVALLRKHYQDLRIKAISLALEDAEAKFKATFNLAGITQFVITKYSEIGTSPIPVGGAKSGASDDVRMPAPVNFDDLTVSEQLNVEFNF
jgi:uncharacterized protein YggE